MISLFYAIVKDTVIKRFPASPIVAGIVIFSTNLTAAAGVAAVVTFVTGPGTNHYHTTILASRSV